MKLEGTQAKSFTDVIAYSVDPVFDKREIVIDTLAADLVPGDVIKADGTKFGAGDAESPLVVIVGPASRNFDQAASGQVRDFYAYVLEDKLNNPEVYSEFSLLPVLYRPDFVSKITLGE